MATPKIFGNPETFAIRYEPAPVWQHQEDTNRFAICHLVINNHLLGYPEEVCYLPTWFSQLSRRVDFINANKGCLFPKEFHGKKDREIFELILKANQLDDEFNPTFLYLPQLSNEIWSRHSFTMDETLDAYLFYFYLRDNRVHFLIEDRSGRDRNERTENFIFSSVSLVDFLTTTKEALNFLQNVYPYLVNHRPNKSG